MGLLCRRIAQEAAELRCIFAHRPRDFFSKATTGRRRLTDDAGPYDEDNQTSLANEHNKPARKKRPVDVEDRRVSVLLRRML